MAKNTFRKFRFIVFMALILSNAFLAYLYFMQEAKSRNLSRLVVDTHIKIGQIQDSLNQKDLQKAYTHLSEAQNRITAFLPPAPAKKATKKEPSKAVATAPPPAGTSAPQAVPAAVVQAPAIPKPVALSIPADRTPQPLVMAVEGEYLLVCEKDTKTLHLFRFTGGKFALVKSYACIVGANNNDKKEAGDLATPKGVYFFLRFVPGKNLPEKYGFGAFVLNYPNFLDRKVRKNGTGIWLHGHSPGKNIGQADLQNTQGCIVVSNDDLKELAGLLKPVGNPIAVVGKLELASMGDHNQTLKDLTKFMEGWRQAWESRNMKKFMSFYGKDFINSDGMNHDAFKRQKEKVTAGKKFIRLKVEEQAILLPPEYNGQVAVVRFFQKYRSNNFDSDSHKLFYLKHDQDGWHIVGESAF